MRAIFVLLRPSLALLVVALAASCQGGGSAAAPDAGGGAPETGGAGAVGGGGGGASSASGSGGQPVASGGVVGGGGAAGEPPGGSGGNAGTVGGATGTGGGATGGSAAGGAAGGTGGGATGAGGQGGAPPACPAVACLGSLVCERSGGGICADASWAAWPMPNSQADVAGGAPNLAAYTDGGDGTITDNVTKLVWQKVPDATTFASLDAAASYCGDLSLGGHDDWRMPSRIELVSLIDYSRSNPAIDPVFGPGQPATSFATMPETNASSVWSVSFFTGSATASGFSDMNRVRCVR